MKPTDGDVVHLRRHPELTGVLISTKPCKGVGDCTIHWDHTNKHTGYILDLLVLVSSPSDNIPEEW